MDTPTAPRPIIPMHTETPHGRVCAVGMKDGDRFYFLETKGGGFALMPADVLERGREPAKL